MSEEHQIKQCFNHDGHFTIPIKFQTYTRISWAKRRESCCLKAVLFGTLTAQELQAAYFKHARYFWMLVTDIMLILMKNR